MHSIRENHKELINNNKLILKSLLRFTVEKRNVFTEEAKNISLSANDDKIIQSVVSIETYGYVTSKV